LPVLADTAPAPAPADAPAAAPEPAADATAAKPATVTAIVRLAGSSLWPFTSLQAAAFKSVVLAGLSSGSDGVTVTQSQLTIGAAKVPVQCRPSLPSVAISHALRCPSFGDVT